MQPPSQERKREDKNENKLRIQEIIANGYMDNSRWKTSGTNFRGKTIRRVYSSWKDLPKATAYLALQNPLFSFVNVVLLSLPLT